jgi:hypothetical protein
MIGANGRPSGSVRDSMSPTGTEPQSSTETIQLARWTPRIGRQAAALLVAQKNSVQLSQLLGCLGSGAFLVCAFAHLPHLAFAVGVPLWVVSLVPLVRSYVYLHRLKPVVRAAVGTEDWSMPTTNARYERWCASHRVSPFPFKDEPVPTHEEARALRKFRVPAPHQPRKSRR